MASLKVASSCSWPFEYVRGNGLNGDVNQGNGGYDIYICMRKETPGWLSPEPDGFVTSLLLSESSHCASPKSRVPAYNGLNGDLNQDTGGKDIFLCQASSPTSGAIYDLKLVSQRGACPPNYDTVPTDGSLMGTLNQDDDERGDIYDDDDEDDDWIELCFSKEPTSSSP